MSELIYFCDDGGVVTSDETPGLTGDCGRIVIDGKTFLYEYIGGTEDGLTRAYRLVYGAHYTTAGMCELLDIKPSELERRAIEAGLIHWDKEKGLQMGAEIQYKNGGDSIAEMWREDHDPANAWKLDPNQGLWPGFYWDEPPPLRQRRTIADAYWEPASIDILSKP